MQSTKKCPICEKQYQYYLYYHYGGISCGSCQAFFRRMTRNNRIKKYQCLNGIECRIHYGWRICKYCRYKKCLANGMEPKLVNNANNGLGDLGYLEDFFNKIAKDFE